MEIQGRECKEIKIGEHSYWFIEKFKGSEVRNVINLVTDEKMKVVEKLMVDKMPELFITLCRRIGEDITPTVSFIDDLDAKEYVSLQNTVIDEVDNLFTQAQ